MKKKINNKLLARLPLNNKILNSILILLSGTVFAQIMNLIMTPIITRIYTVDEYGSLTIYLSLLAILGLGAFEYNKGISITKTPLKAINLVYLSTILVLLSTLLVTILLFLFKGYIVEIFNLKSSLLLYFLPFGVLLSGLYKIFMHWSFRERNYSLITKTKMTQSIFGNLITIILGAIGYGAIGILLGALSKTGLGVSSLYNFFRKSLSSAKVLINVNMLSSLFYEYKNFALYSTPSELFKRTSNHLPILFITIIFGTVTTGYFGLAYTVINLPLILIGNSVSDVFFSEAAKLGIKNTSEIKKISISLFKKLLLVSSGPFLILFVFGPNLFEIIFGDDWYRAGEFAKALTILGFTVVVFDPISKVYDILGRQRELLYLDTIRLVIILLTFGISVIFNFSALNTVYIYASLFAIINVMVYLRSLMLLKKFEIKIISGGKYD